MSRVSSKDRREGSIHQLRRVVGLVSAIALVLMLSGGVNARQLRLDSPEARVTHQRNLEHMILMLKLRTDAGRQVLIYG
jgi:hypothetical protein